MECKYCAGEMKLKNKIEDPEGRFKIENYKCDNCKSTTSLSYININDKYELNETRYQNYNFDNSTPEGRLKLFLEEYMDKNNCDSVICTLQSEDVHECLKKGNFIADNTIEHPSYEWFKDQLGYYPIFGLKVNRSDFDDWYNVYGYILPGDRKEYCYIIEPSKNNMVETNFFRWVDIRYLLSPDGARELENERDKISLDYMKNLTNSDYTQIIFDKIEGKDVLQIIKYR